MATALQLFMGKIQEAKDWPDMSVQDAIDRLFVEFQGGRACDMTAILSWTSLEFMDCLLVRWGSLSADIKKATGLTREQWIRVADDMSRQEERYER